MGVRNCFELRQFKILLFAAVVGLSACKKTEEEASSTSPTRVAPSPAVVPRPFVPPDNVVVPPPPVEIASGTLNLSCSFSGPDYKMTATWTVPTGVTDNILRRRTTGLNWDLSQYKYLALTQNSFTETVIPGQSYDYQIKFSSTQVTPLKTLLVKSANCTDMTPPIPPPIPPLELNPVPRAGQVNVTVRTGSTVTANASTGVTNYRFVDGAYDKVNKKFLMVYGQNPVGGFFLDDDGNQEGAGFQIASAAKWTQNPRVACASNENICLVTFHKSITSSLVNVYGKLLRYTTGGVPAFASDEFFIGGAISSNHESPPAVAYSPDHREFLVTWTVVDKGAYARRVKTSGAMPDAEFALTLTNASIEGSSVAYNGAEQSFYVVAKQAYSTLSAIISRKIKGGTNQVSGSATLDTNLTQAKITDIEYDESNKRVMAFWYAGSAFKASYLGSSGAVLDYGTTVFAPFASYDGFDVSYSPKSKTFFGVFHGSNAEDWGAELDGFFAQTTPFQATAGSTNGSYNPRIVAHPEKPFWMIITSRDFSSVVLQKITRQ